MWNLQTYNHFKLDLKKLTNIQGAIGLSILDGIIPKKLIFIPRIDHSVTRPFSEYFLEQKQPLFPIIPLLIKTNCFQWT